MPEFKPGLAFALEMDQQDPVRDYKNRFYIPEKNTIYLDGNSLGRLPLKTREIIQHQVDHQWGNRLIRSWNEGWYDRSTAISKKIAQIIGAREDEVITGDSTSLNLYKLIFAALNSNTGRKKIVSDNLNFPTDLYIIQGIVQQLGSEYSLELATSMDGQSVDLNTLDKTIDSNTALVVLSHVAFKSAFMYNMEAVTKLAHQKGALILWDLSHAAGAVPVELNRCNADLAVGCTYKYLNGGPGSPAYLYVKKELQGQLNSPIWGWFGDKNPFQFDLKYQPSDEINKFLVGTPPILSLEAITPGVDLILEVGMDKIREKSKLLSDYLIFLYHNELKELGFILGTPEQASLRGSHVSIQHPEANRICKALINPIDDEPVVIPDFRKPDNIRLGLTPLYTSYTEILKTIKRIKNIVLKKEFASFTHETNAVT